MKILDLSFVVDILSHSVHCYSALWWFSLSRSVFILRYYRKYQARINVLNRSRPSAAFYLSIIDILKHNNIEFTEQYFDFSHYKADVLWSYFLLVLKCDSFSVALVKHDIFIYFCNLLISKELWMVIRI